MFWETTGTVEETSEKRSTGKAAIRSGQAPARVKSRPHARRPKPGGGHRDGQLRAKRDLIETVIGMLADQFTLETTRARSLWGVMTRLGAKLLAFNLSLALNQMLGRRMLALKDLYL